MNRKRQTVIFIVIIFVLGIWRFGGAQQIYVSPEKVLYACERGLHYGPSDKVLLKKKIGKEVLVIGKLSDGLSVVKTEKSLLGMWRIADGGITGKIEAVKDADVFYSNTFKLVYGYSKNPEIKSVKFSIEKVSGDSRNIIDTFECTVDSDGFFYADTPEYEYDSQSQYLYAVDLLGFDESENLIYSEL